MKHNISKGNTNKASHIGPRGESLKNKFRTNLKKETKKSQKKSKENQKSKSHKKINNSQKSQKVSFTFIRAIYFSYRITLVCIFYSTYKQDRVRLEFVLKF